MNWEEADSRRCAALLVQQFQWFRTRTTIARERTTKKRPWSALEVGYRLHSALVFNDPLRRRRLQDDMNNKCQDEQHLNSKIYDLERKNVVLTTEHKEVRSITLPNTFLVFHEGFHRLGPTKIRTRIRQSSNVGATFRRNAAFVRSREKSNGSDGGEQSRLIRKSHLPRATSESPWLPRSLLILLLVSI